jgi:hypothetical protein
MQSLLPPLAHLKCHKWLILKSNESCLCTRGALALRKVARGAATLVDRNWKERRGRCQFIYGRRVVAFGRPVQRCAPFRITRVHAYTGRSRQRCDEGAVVSGDSLVQRSRPSRACSTHVDARTRKQSL